MIHFVNATSVTRTNYAATQTINFAAGASDFIVVWVSAYGGGDIFTGVTFNGQAMTREVGASGQSDPSHNVFMACYWIIGQSGTHDVVVSISAPCDLLTAAASYSGTLQTVDVIQTNGFVSEVNANVDIQLTNPNLINNWVVGTLASFGEALTIALTGVVRTQTDVNYMLADSGTEVAPGVTYHLKATMNSSQGIGSALAIASAVSTAFPQITMH